MDCRFLFHDSTLDIALGVGPSMALDNLDALNHDFLVARHDDKHAPGFPTVLAAENVDLVILFDWGKRRHLNHLRRQRNDLHESLVAQLTSDRPENTGAD